MIAWIAGGIAAWLVASLVVGLLVGRVLARQRPQERRSRPAEGEAPPDRAQLLARVGELEAQLPAVVRQVRELEDSIETRFRRLHGRVSADKRWRGQEDDEDDAQLPMLPPELLREVAEKGLPTSGGAPVAPPTDSLTGRIRPMHRRHG